jgi:hypothetical protein
MQRPCAPELVVGGPAEGMGQLLQMAANGVELVVKIVDIERLQESASIAFSLTPARHRVLLKKAAGARLRRERPLIHVRA